MSACAMASLKCSIPQPVWSMANASPHPNDSPPILPLPSGEGRGEGDLGATHTALPSGKLSVTSTVAHFTLSLFQISYAGLTTSGSQMIPAFTHANSGFAGCNVNIGEPHVPQKQRSIIFPVSFTDRYVFNSVVAVTAKSFRSTRTPMLKALPFARRQ